MLRKHLTILLMALVLAILGTRAQGVTKHTLLLMPHERGAQLPIHSIHRVIQDSRGYMWYGTVNGLCRDDGYSIKVYRNDYLHPQSVASNHVNCLAEDSAHHIIIGTRNGAYYLDHAMQRLQPVAQNAFAGCDISDVVVLSDGRICMCCADRAFFVSDVGSQKVLETIPDKTVKGDWQYYSLFTDGKTLLAIIFGRGPYQYRANDNTWQPIPHNGELNYVSDVCQGDGCLWFSSFYNGIQRVVWPVKTESAIVTQVSNPSNVFGTSDLENWRIRCNAADSLLWMISKDDLYAFRVHADGTATHTRALMGFGGREGGSMYQKMLSDCYIDRDGNLFVVNFEGEHFMVSHNSDGGIYYPLLQIRNKYKNRVVVSAACCDPGQPASEIPLLWVSQERTGLCLYNTADGSVSAYFDNADMAQLPLHWVPSIKPSRTPHRVWVITRPNIVYQIERQGMKMRVTDQVDIRKRSKATVTSIYEDSKGLLWIGTQNEMLVYEPTSRVMKVVDANMPAITDFAETSDGRVWATVPGRGLCEVDRQLHTTIHQHEGNHLCVAATSDGCLWIGTGEGDLLCYTPSEGFRSWASVFEFNGDMIDNIAVDEYNHVWVQMNQMLCELNPSNKAFRKIHCRGETSFDAYPSSYEVESMPIQLNHLPLHRFMPKALFRDAAGAVYLGGFGGVLKVLPTHALEGIPEQRAIRLTDVKVMGESILTEENSVSLTCSAQYIEFSFSTLDYIHASSIRYACRMEGVDHDWIYLPDGQNTALYTQLPRGHHRLHVKATDANGLWMYKEFSIDVYREPYWWESTVAFVIYVLFTLALVVAAVLLYRRHLRRQNEQLWQDSNAMQALRQYVACTEAGRTIAGSVADENVDFVQLDRQLIEKARAIIRSHMGDADFNVVVLANEMGMSRSTLTRRFKAILGDTPLHFITQMRMEAAKSMLSTNKSVSVAEVAARVGFADAKYFAAVYKETFGILPSEEKK